MRRLRTLAGLAALSLFSISAASASTVIVTFSGTFAFSELPGLTAGTPVSGTVTYSTGLPLAGGSVEGGDPQYGLPTGALTLDADGSVSNANPDLPDLYSSFLEVGATINPGFNTLVFNAFLMAGGGPLDGVDARLSFAPSSNPQLVAFQIPYPFPSELTSADLSVFDGAGGIAEASVGILSVQNIPESSTWAMLLIGFAGLGVAGWRAARTRAAFSASREPRWAFSRLSPRWPRCRSPRSPFTRRHRSPGSRVRSSCEQATSSI
jgi:hypothetical protein